MTIELQSMAVEMPEVQGHPNRAAFRGVLTVVDEPSQRAPQGSKGRRVLLTRKAAEAAVPSLLGMAVDYAPSLDRHDMQRKVGVITRADVVGRNLEVGGFLYAKDFPGIVNDIARLGRRPVEIERRMSGGGCHASIFGVASEKGEGTRLRASLAAAVKEIRGMIRNARTRGVRRTAPVMLNAETPRVLLGRAGESALGMSFEVTNVNVFDKSARIWKLISVTFTGAAILRKDKAAFQDTWIELEGK